MEYELCTKKNERKIFCITDILAQVSIQKLKLEIYMNFPYKN